MSYSLDLVFKTASPRRRIFEHFAARKYFRDIENDLVLYEHPDTAVYFRMTLRGSRNALLQRTVVAVEFDINYSRPSYFGLEAEKELSAFVAAFRPHIHDPQMHGMGDGPYSDTGFLEGWNFGNLCSIAAGLARRAEFGRDTMPGDDLRAVWAWNYGCPERTERFERSAFVPKISFFRIDGRLRRVAVWPLALPIILPKVDYVLVGRQIGGEKRYGLARWPEVLEVVRRAGLDTTNDPLDIRYLVTPPPIARWFADIPLIDFAALERLEPWTILDEDLIAAARASLKEDRVASDDR